MVLITGTVAAAAGSATASVYGEIDSLLGASIYYIGKSYIPGSEILSAGTFLEWFAETPTGGGSFGEPPPDNARIRARGILSGSLVQDAYLGVGDPFAGANIVEGVATLTGSLIVSAKIQNNVLQALSQLDGLTALTLFLTGDINAVAVVTGDVRSIAFPELDPEVLVGVLGRRPCFPLWIYLTDVTHVDNLQVDGQFVVGLYQAFLVSPDFDPSPGAFLTDRGALPNSIGMRVVMDIQGDGIDEEVVLFRRPLENEVVVVLDGAVVLRWNESEQAWKSYRTITQRALDGVRLFEMLDPAGIYDFYAKMLGLKYVQLAVDTDRILDFIDPTLCPSAYVPVLARNFGCPVDSQQPEEEQRELIRNWIPLMQIKGLPQAVPVALRTLGFSGYATHIWVKPGGEADEFIERPFSYDNTLPSGSPDEYYPASQVAIHLNNPDGSPLLVIDSGTKLTVAKFLKENVLPAHIRIRTFTTDTPVGAEAVAVDDGAGVAVITDVRVALVAAVAGPATVAISGTVLPIKGTVAAQADRATAAISGEVIG